MWSFLISSAIVWLLPVVHCNVTPKPYSIYKTPKEHKVHNIMLYPEKHSWCKPTSIKQVVTHPGCTSVEMENNVCVGACFSFFVPRTIPETPGDELLYYCDSCQPNVVSWTSIILECPQTPDQASVTKSVEMIENCTCMSGTYKRTDEGSRGSISEESKESSSGEEDFVSAESNNVAEFQDFVLRHVSKERNESSTTGSSEVSNTLADNITTAKERFLKLNQQNTDLLLQELGDDINEEDNEDEDEDQ